MNIVVEKPDNEDEVIIKFKLNNDIIKDDLISFLSSNDFDTILKSRYSWFDRAVIRFKRFKEYIKTSRCRNIKQ